MVPDHKGLAITAPFRLNTRRSITSLQIARMLQIWTERKHIIAKFGHPLAADRLPARTWRPPGSSLHRNHAHPTTSLVLKTIENGRIFRPPAEDCLQADKQNGTLGLGSQPHC